jgi:hypothetical protein
MFYCYCKYWDDFSILQTLFISTLHQLLRTTPYHTHHTHFCYSSPHTTSVSTHQTNKIERVARLLGSKSERLGGLDLDLLTVSMVASHHSYGQFGTASILRIRMQPFLWKKLQVVTGHGRQYPSFLHLQYVHQPPPAFHRHTVGQGNHPLVLCVVQGSCGCSLSLDGGYSHNFSGYFVPLGCTLLILRPPSEVQI